MRIPIALSLLILMIGLILGWHDHQQFAMVRANHDQLVAEAAESGITFDPTFPDKGVFIAKRERKNDEEETKKLSAAIIALLNEIEVLEKTGVPPTEAMRNQHRDYLFRARSLDLAQLKIFISEVHANVDLEDKTRQGILGHLIPYFSHINPQAGLELYREAADLLNRDGLGKQIIPSSLAKWAKDDPAAAVGWLRKNGGNFSDLLNDDAKGGLISGAAANEPKLAFRLIEELEFKDSDSAIRRIADAAKTADGRSATLVALREYLATHPGGEMQRAASIYALRSLARLRGLNSKTGYFLPC